jgi:hypothetical protein
MKLTNLNYMQKRIVYSSVQNTLFLSVADACLTRIAKQKTSHCKNYTVYESLHMAQLFYIN